MNGIISWLLGLERMQSISDHKFSFQAAWAQRAPLWLLLGFVGLAAVAATFYFRFQAARHPRWKFMLFVLRAAVLCQLLLLLAEPVLTLTIQSQKRPALWLLFDGTDSMNIADDLPADVRAVTNKAVGFDDSGRSPGESGATSDASKRTSRSEYLQALVRKKDQNLLDELNKRFRLQAFLFDSPQSVRSIELAATPGKIDGAHIADQLTAKGKVTDLDAALGDLAHRNTSGGLGGLVVFSDFDNNHGSAPGKIAGQFRAKIYTVGVGGTEAADLSIDSLKVDPGAKKGEDTSISVNVAQKGLLGKTAHVRLFAEPLDDTKGKAGSGAVSRELIGEQSVELSKNSQTIEFTYKPAKAGTYQIIAQADKLPGEVAEENNTDRANLVVLDDYLRMMFVEYEPTWEWRFIKEVFHRDPLVGPNGFRTFLYSSDPQVRRQGDLFLPTMSPPNSEFFKYDLIFLGDMPASALSERFCGMVKQFVQMGGGLVIVSGPHFGPQQLAKTVLADLLPVRVDPSARVSDRESFNLQLTSHAHENAFMQLGAGSSPKDLETSWENLGQLPWYQPVRAIHNDTQVLAEHPTAICPDDGRKQPLIAMRRFGDGEVVYLAFDETWRLRRGQGEELFRKFWSQLMWRLALNHSLGDKKRFVVKTDSPRYKIDDVVRLTVKARNAEYQLLDASEIAEHQLKGELLLPAPTGQSSGAQAARTQSLTLTQVRKGEFQVEFPAMVPGDYKVSVIDPIKGKPSDLITFTVYSLPLERQHADRSVPMQEAIAAASGGRSCDLKDVNSLLDWIQPTPLSETSVEVVSLVNTWLCFFTVAGMLIAEWLLRKWIRLP